MDKWKNKQEQSSSLSHNTRKHTQHCTKFKILNAIHVVPEQYLSEEVWKERKLDK